MCYIWKLAGETGLLGSQKLSVFHNKTAIYLSFRNTHMLSLLNHSKWSPHEQNQTNQEPNFVHTLIIIDAKAPCSPLVFYPVPGLLTDTGTMFRLVPVKREQAETL